MFWRVKTIRSQPFDAYFCIVFEFNNFQSCVQESYALFHTEQNH